ncbi:DNA repair protein recO [Methylobacter tundripaludum SV96]|uniref:DNA repair protein RecO n=2 Tax=Methylobacter tundripaludum TaxID=173365 RepID=G3ISF3_METTV|nr:DNA repair protein recO [Methylobacter tundripaludum SV96]
MNEPCKAWALMTESAVYLQPAFILRHRKYRETSLIIDVLTRDFGRISLLAKGVRKAKSKTAGMLQPFIPLLVSYFGKAELKTLTDVEMIQPFSEIKGLALYCGFYINELVGYFLHKYDPHPEVFGHYGECLSCLSDGPNVEAALRQFELNLMECAGYGLQLEYDDNESPIESLKKYEFNAGKGAVEVVDGPFSGKTLLALSSGELTDPQVLSEAKTLMRTVIDVYLQGRQLKSRAVINKVFATAQRLDQ